MDKSTEGVDWSVWPFCLLWEIRTKTTLLLHVGQDVPDHSINLYLYSTLL